ncbi:hypothetical protein G6F57_007272 [Rhizopus arrhizus]|nr:hypothetical protein G6F24_003289 [Rhizopus arrhizus]KAG1416233.1 hypothetical protein G6F58_006076 [Rhizopus delemar]KAG0795879.1 hypothetical protein G6F21_001754 [Rhizopus arrhizus]KAG0800706.1 hypothetical protein G6F22_001965 [Rhizopus arrhizus]KAG0817955.1 hypothetical protein G6F20_001964 [Rhizopus arrhizus]
MDNAPIHTHSDIDELITLRGYRSIYLLTYSPELNPIEQFWSVVKNKVKRGTFSDDEDLKTRIADACNNVPIQHVKAFIQHSLIPAIRNRIMTTQRTDNEYFTKKHRIVHQQFPTNSEVMIKNVNRNSKLTEGYPPEYDTWEPVSSFNGMSMIEQYWARRNVNNNIGKRKRSSHTNVPTTTN